MNKGDKLFKYWDGKLKTAIFLEESLSDPSCTETTYLCRGEDGHKFRCSTDHYQKSEQAAYALYLKELREAIGPTTNALADAQKQMRWLNSEILRMENLLEPKPADLAQDLAAAL